MKILAIILLGITLFSTSALHANTASLTTTASDIKRYEANINTAREAAFKADLKQQKLSEQEAANILAAAKKRSEELRQQFSKNEASIEQASEELRLRTGSLGEMFGVVRQVSSDLNNIVSDSIVRADGTTTPANLSKLAESKALPQLKELRQLWQTLRQEIKLNSQITHMTAPVVQADGSTLAEDVIRIGAFNALQATGYLVWDNELAAFRSLPRQPEESALIPGYLKSNSSINTVAIDPSRGALLSINAIAPSWQERLEQGGTIGYIIILIGFIGLAIAIWRLVTLAALSRGINRQLSSVSNPTSDNALGGILEIGRNADNTQTDSELLEARLDEAVLRELPTIERGQGIIRLLAGIAPLLGLLGTVTGMIATFQVITAFGSGDAKLMAAGISQALITTVLGLIVAIPLLLLHSWVTSRSRTLVQILDEQSAGIMAETLESTKGSN